MDVSLNIPPNKISKTQCKIQAKNLFYSLPDHHQVGKLGWLSWGEAVSPSISTKHILRNINFEAKPGEITAIAGASGAGKTTLLDILAGNSLPGRITGHIIMNNQPMNSHTLSTLSGYVTQEEALFPLLTVEETLLFSARFRRPKCDDGSDVNVRVRKLIRELGLEHVSNARIGGGDSSGRGISGGEKRRVSIGVELVHDPAILFMDEVTSGLDSSSALQVMLLLKSLAVKQKGKTVVITIHQPGFRVLQLIDHVVLLSRGGLAFQGPLSLLEERLKWAGHEIPPPVNVLEFAIETLVDLNDEYGEVIGDDESDDDEQVFQVAFQQNSEGFNERSFFYPNTRSKEILILAQRFSYNIFRTRELFATRMTQAIVAGFLLGNIFMNAYNNQENAKLQTQLGFIAFSLTVLLSSTTEALPIFLQERRVLIRETSRGTYRVSSYIIANAVVFAPFLLAVAVVYSSPVYWLVGLRREIDGFLYFCLVVWLVVLMSNSFVAACSTVVPSFIMGSCLIAGTMGGFFLFSGYFITKEDIPKYWLFMHYLSLFRYPLDCFILNEYGGDQGKKRCVQSVRGKCVLFGDWIVAEQGIKESQKWSNLGVMLGFIFSYRLLSFFILWYRSYRARATKSS